MPGRRRKRGKLTRRELESLAAVVRHGSDKAAAVALGISLQTVKNHLWNARARVDLDTTAQLVWRYRAELEGVLK